MILKFWWKGFINATWPAAWCWMWFTLTINSDLICLLTQCAKYLSTHFFYCILHRSQQYRSQPPRLQDFRGYKCVFALICVKKLLCVLYACVCGRKVFWHLRNYANIFFFCTDRKWTFFFFFNVCIYTALEAVEILEGQVSKRDAESVSIQSDLFSLFVYKHQHVLYRHCPQLTTWTHCGQIT